MNNKELPCDLASRKKAICFVAVLLTEPRGMKYMLKFLLKINTLNFNNLKNQSAVWLKRTMKF